MANKSKFQSVTQSVTGTNDKHYQPSSLNWYTKKCSFTANSCRVVMLNEQVFLQGEDS